MGQFISHKERSKQNWGIDDDKNPSIEQLSFGCLARIADATEAMAVNHLRLQNELQFMKNSRDNYRQYYESEQRRSAAYKGQITRLKNKLRTFTNN